MAYSAVPTAYDNAPGWGAQWLIRYVKDNFAAGVPDIFTTKGDLAVATAADVATRQAVGTVNGYVLFADSSTSTGLNWGFPGLVKANDAGTQSTVTLDKLTELDNEFYDLYEAWASDRFTCSYAGYYLITGMIQLVRNVLTWTADAGGELLIYKNGSYYSMLAAGVAHTAGSNYLISISGADIVYLADGDYIDFYGRARSGYAINVNPNAEDVSHHISITYLPSV